MTNKRIFVSFFGICVLFGIYLIVIKSFENYYLIPQQKQYASKLIEAFNNNKVLLYKGDGVHALISQQKGWILNNRNFKNDDMSVEIGYSLSIK